MSCARAQMALESLRAHKFWEQGRGYWLFLITEEGLGRQMIFFNDLILAEEVVNIVYTQTEFDLV